MPSRKPLLCAALPVIVALAVSANTLPGDFVFDDVVLLERGRALQELDLSRVFASNYWGADRADRNYRPLTLLSYALNFRLGRGAWSFHLVNLLLAAALALLAHGVLLRLTGDGLLSALGASLWAVLPIRVEAVANIVGRAELLAALSALGLWLLSLARPRSLRSAAVAGAALLLGLCSKESAVVALLIVPGAAWLLRRSQPWPIHAGMVVALLLYLGVRAAVLVGKESPVTFVDNPLAFADAPSRIVNAVSLLGLYLEETILPYVRVGLSADYSYNQLPVLPLSSGLLWLRAGSTAALLGGALLLWRRAPLVALGSFVFLAASSLTANVAFSIGTIFGERLAFLPSLGYPIAALGAVSLLAPRARQRLGVPVLVALIAVYSAGTWHRNGDWASSAHMGVRMAQDAPRSTRAHLKGADARVEMWREAGRKPGDPLLDEALRDTERSLAIYPSHIQAIAKKGEVLLRQKRYADAIAALTEALRLMVEADPPSYEPLVLHHRGEAFLNVERWADAERDLVAYLSIPRFTNAPESAAAWSFLGLARARQERLTEAKEAFDKGIALNGELPELRSNRGFCRFLLGDLDGARQDYEAGLVLCRKQGLLDGVEGESAWKFLRKLADVELAAARKLRGAGGEGEAQAAEAKARGWLEEAARIRPPSPTGRGP